MRRALHIGAIIVQHSRGTEHRYACFDAWPHVNRAGHETMVYALAGLCATCGADFVLTVGAGATWLTRNCPEHRRRRSLRIFRSPDVAREYEAAVLRLKGAKPRKTKSGPAVGAIAKRRRQAEARIEAEYRRRLDIEHAALTGQVPWTGCEPPAGLLG